MSSVHLMLLFDVHYSPNVALMTFKDIFSAYDLKG